MAKQKTITIKELRVSQGLSQAAFAKVIGVSTASVGSYEAGRVSPGEKVLDRIKEVYGVMVSGPKNTEEKPAEKAKKTPAKKAAGNAVRFVIQSPLGGEITPEEILAKVGEADTVYVRVDENKAYWVRGEETGSVDLW